MIPTSTAVAFRQPATAITEIQQSPPPQESLPLVVPVASTDKILRAWADFQDLKLRLLDEHDFAVIRGERFAKKSAFRKLALAFGVSTEVVREDRIEFKDSTAYLFTVKASSANRNRSMIGSGSCHTDERRFPKPSDCRAVAETRATNRAIANLLGWSQVSVEEVIGGEVETDAPVAKVVLPKEPDQIRQPSPDQEHGMTDKQRNLLVSLINQRVSDPEEHETALQAIETYDKHDASEMISHLLNQEA